LDYHAPSSAIGPAFFRARQQRTEYFLKENIMGKSQDAKKNVKKEPTKTPKEKKEAKRLKKAEKKH
jgi:hypothetical protein